ncbi:histidine phosphatase family protein [bacterium LRH843]|nr:histidine phosphatase family protein [bacterium LRH843]
MNVYLIRHGESMGNQTGKIQGIMDFALSEFGREQVQLLASYFERVQLDYVYSSDLSRAYETAQAIGQAKKLSVHAWDQIREVNLGPFQGLSRAEIYERFPITKEKSILTSGLEGTETIEQLTARCKHVKKQLQLAHNKDHVAIVSHGGFISIFLMYLLTGDEWHTYHRPFQIANTSITHIEWTDEGQPLIHYLNQTGHLETLQTDQQKKGLL